MRDKRWRLKMYHGKEPRRGLRQLPLFVPVQGLVEWRIPSMVYAGELGIDASPTEF